VSKEREIIDRVWMKHRPWESSSFMDAYLDDLEDQITTYVIAHATACRWHGYDKMRDEVIGWLAAGGEQRVLQEFLKDFSARDVD
jgi:hypothetical protein